MINNRFINRFLILLIFLPITSFAVGWNDYSQDIGDGFKITRFNSTQIMLYDKKDWGSVIPTREHGDNIGPITHYFSGVDNLYIKTTGLIIKNTENGREYKAPNYSEVFYFIVNKSNSAVKGPLIQAEFKTLIKSNIALPNSKVSLSLFSAMQYIVMEIVKSRKFLVLIYFLNKAYR